MLRLVRSALLAAIVLWLGACASLGLTSEADRDISLGTITPGSVEGIPDWTMDNVRSCYAEGLRLDPDQQGELVFAVRPPEQTGPVEALILASSGLSTDLVECIRSSFGTIHHYVGSGRTQQAVSDTLRLTRVVTQACEPPTARAVERVASGRYGESGVVDLTDLDVTVVQHRVSVYDPSLVLRFMVADVELTFNRDGYEGQCYHHNEYKVFSADPIEAEGVGHVCESIRRRRGDRVSDTITVVFGLDREKWWEWESQYKAYCGSRRIWLAYRD